MARAGSGRRVIRQVEARQGHALGGREVSARVARSEWQGHTSARVAPLIGFHRPLLDCRSLTTQTGHARSGQARRASCIVHRPLVVVARPRHRPRSGRVTRPTLRSLVSSVVCSASICCWLRRPGCARRASGERSTRQSDRRRTHQTRARPGATLVSGTAPGCHQRHPALHRSITFGELSCNDPREPLRSYAVLASRSQPRVLEAFTGERECDRVSRPVVPRLALSSLGLGRISCSQERALCCECNFATKFGHVDKSASDMVHFGECSCLAASGATRGT